VVPDNDSTHKHLDVQAWLVKHQRFDLHDEPNPKGGGRPWRAG